MWGWFGGSGAAQRRKDAPKKAIIGLREQLDMLQKRERHLEAQIAEADATARKHIATNKNGMFLECRSEGKKIRTSMCEQETYASNSAMLVCGLL